jgi:pimeloyl-[acyl-carrier protein] methyl ester esterase
MRTQELESRLRRVLDGIPRPVIARRANEVLRVDKRNVLLGVRCPILCLHGRFDRLVGKAVVKEFMSDRPNAHVEWFDAPHMRLETKPSETADLVDEFCRWLTKLPASE